MEKTRTYYASNQTYTFDIVREEKVEVNICYGVCRENGKTAWLDNLGLQFEGEEWFQASQRPVPMKPKCYISYEHDPMYPEDSIEMTRFWNTEKEAREYRKRVIKECPDICVEIYEVKPIV